MNARCVLVNRQNDRRGARKCPCSHSCHDALRARALARAHPFADAPRPAALCTCAAVAFGPQGETIERALRRGEADAHEHAASSPSMPRQLSFSFDMLGEAARTREDADTYWEAYAHAIRTVGDHAAAKAADGGGGGGGVIRPGLSVKLSALDPRFEPSHRAALLGHEGSMAVGVGGGYGAVAGAGAGSGKARASLVDSVAQLAAMAADANVDLTIDAEEASRLELQLDLASAVSKRLATSHPGWDGLGIAVQTYQRRATAVVDWLADVARRDGRRLKVRLVKGAYWDTEIKAAQTLGLPTFPVFTRKEATDVSYAACAAKVLNEHADAIVPAFATVPGAGLARARARARVPSALRATRHPHTRAPFCATAALLPTPQHNARTLAVVAALARAKGWTPGEPMGEGSSAPQFELQRLHGMGQDLHDAATARGGCLAGVPVRVYAPVGVHDQLLAYLVRRLLENGVRARAPASLELAARAGAFAARQAGGADRTALAPLAASPCPPAQARTRRSCTRSRTRVLMLLILRLTPPPRCCTSTGLARTQRSHRRRSSSALAPAPPCSPRASRPCRPELLPPRRRRPPARRRCATHLRGTI